MRNSKFTTGWAMMLGLILLMSGLALAQDKSAIERMNERVADWTKSRPHERFAAFEMVFPKDAGESDAMSGDLLLLVTVVSQNDWDDITSVSIVSGGARAALTSLDDVKHAAADFSSYREDRIYRLPKTAAGSSVLEATVDKKNPTTISLGVIPQPPQLKEENQPVKAAPDQFNQILKREFNGLGIRPTKVRVSSAVEQGLLVKQAHPHYPVEARKAHITGSVVLAVDITREGKVQNIRVIAGPPSLVDAAVEAVRQWEYKPYLLNGKPVEVETTVTINFNIG